MASMRRIDLTGSAPRREARLGPSTRALSPRGIWVALLAAMVLAGMAFWSTAAYADGEEAGEPVWSADMTVVEYTTVSIGAASADLFSNVAGSGDLQIKSLWSYIPDRDLRLAFTDEVPNAADYTLQVGDFSLEFPAGSSGASSFKWNDVDVDWEDGQLIRVRIVLTSELTSESGAQQANTPATGVPTVRGTVQVGETLAADTSDIADEDGLESVSYHYQWIRTEAHIADATDSTYTLTDDDQGKTIRLKVSFIDDNGNSETLTSAATAEVSKRPQFLVSNLGVGVEGAGGIQRTLNAARSGFAQAFTTGAKTNGYVLGSVDIQVSHFFDASNTADQLRMTINGVSSEGEPGDAHCTLTNPSSFTALSVITFEAPTGAGSCPQLAAETTYFVVIEWISPTATDSFAVIPQTYPTKESAATAEDPGGAEGWSIADHSYYLSVSSDARTWTAYDETASFKIKVEEGAAIAAKANSPATGVPTISGTVQVGETLTADTSGIADEDGIDDVEFSYQWLADDTDIDGATSSSYELTSSEQGQTIQVRVSFADDAENEETLTSAATAAVAAKANSPATGLLTITGTPQVGQTLTADTSAIEDEDGLENVSYEYQWIAGGTDIEGPTSSSYELTSSEQGQTIQVRVTFTDDAENEETLTSAATEAVATAPNHPATGAPTITGTPQVDHTLTAGISPIADEDGLDNVSYSYQWISGGSDIDGATGSTYTLTASEQGQTIQVRVTFTDDADNEETLTSAATVVVQQGSNAWSATMTVETRDGFTGYSFWGNPHLGSLSATEVEWDGKTHYVRYIFLKDGELRLGLNEEMFSTGFVLSVGDEEFGSANAMVDKRGASYRFRWDDPGLGWSDGNEVSVNLVQSDQNTPALIAPTISGTAQVDETLTVDTTGIEDADGLTNVSYGYQWMADGVDMQNATSSTYKLVFPNQGKTIKVRVTFTDDRDNQETLTSNPTGPVTAAPNRQATGLPTISGTPQVDQTLTADTSNIADQDGLTHVSYSYQWIAGGTDIDGATGSSYKLTSSEQGQTIKVRMTFTDDRDNAEMRTSNATTAVAAAPNRQATGLPTISGTPQVEQMLTADTSSIDDADGLTNATFEYQWIAGGSDIGGATGSTYTLTASEQGQTIQVRVTFTDDADNEETLTSEATEAVAAKSNTAPTGLPTITGTPQVEQTLTADTSAIADEDGLDGVSYEYQWIVGSTDIVGATDSSYALAASELGKTIQVRVTFTDDADNQETLTSEATEAVAAAPVPLTVSVTVSAPATHDGSSEFTFDIEFSEEFGLSYVTLKNHAFNVTGGSVKRAQRTDKPSNISWRITVKPQGNGDVTIELPATTDCNADGAICTGDGRKLSNSLSFTVSGPGD